MNVSNPSTVVGGGEMNRATSSVVSSAKSEGASDARSSRSVTLAPASTGRPLCQSLLVTASRGRATSPIGAWNVCTSSSER